MAEFLPGGQYELYRDRADRLLDFAKRDGIADGFDPEGFPMDMILMSALAIWMVEPRGRWEDRKVYARGLKRLAARVVAMIEASISGEAYVRNRNAAALRGEKIDG